MSQTAGIGFGQNINLKDYLGSIKDLGSVSQTKISHAIQNSLALDQNSAALSKVKQKKVLTDKENVKK